MMKRLKPILFKIFKKIYNSLIKTSLIRKIPGLFPVYDFLFRVLWPYPEVLEIQGSKMYLNVRERNPLMRKTFQSYALSREWEGATTKLFKKVVKEGEVFVDLGANIGYFSLLAARLVGPKGRVYAFEPEPQNYSYLKKNIKLNNYKNVQTIQKAVSDRNGETKLYICHYDSGHHTINQNKGIKEYRPDFIEREEFIEIETVALDNFFRDREEKIDVIKMDIEGAEMLAISGMDRTIKENKNLKMFVEFFPLLIREMGSSPKEFIQKLLNDYCFSIFVIGQDYSMGDIFDKEYLKVNSAEEVMSFCRGKEDHINLFIKKNV